jgi:hypothetical protein
VNSPTFTDAAKYAGLFRDLLKNVVFVIIPGQKRGSRFIYSCMIWLQAVMRRGLTKGAKFDVFHTLDDDWLEPRVFDHIGAPKYSMRPCSLFLALKTNEAVSEIS